LVKVAESLAEALVANIIVEAVKESARRLLMVHTSDEEERDEYQVNIQETETLAPRFEVAHEVYNVKIGENVTIHATINGAPCHTVEWYRDGEKVETSR
jgi:hypothetical protein